MNDARRCLAELDVDGMRALWRRSAPHLVQGDDDQTLVAMHMARTAAESIPLQARIWSHHWLTDHGYPSQLSDELRPRAERIHPVVIEAVGIACASSSPALRPICKVIERKMSERVAELYADGCRDVGKIRLLMRYEYDLQKRHFAELINAIR